jgi:hypothetical protein
MSKAPKSMKDPVMIAGKWEERQPIPITAGMTRAVPNEGDKEHLEDIKGKKFLKRKDYLKSVGVKI